ncbi:Pentatricopeptide repeat-containing protein [Nymphaea thermarum]|nr:Pentatricopeptide repeat-containing protein [Nymphaea thermarum]
MAVSTALPCHPPSSFGQPKLEGRNGQTHQRTLSLLKGCKTIEEFKQIQATIIKTNLQSDVPSVTRLIRFCSFTLPDALDFAVHLFEQISQPDVVLFNTAMGGYARTSCPIRAVSLFARMRESDLLPDHYSFPSVLKACANATALKEGEAIHGLVIKLGVDDNVYILPTLINMYADCEQILSARKVFDKIPERREVVSFNSMITAYARNSQPNEALALFREMQACDDMKPTYVTLLSVLSSCALLGALQLGKWVHEYVKKNGFDVYVKVNTALIDMYAKCGSIDDAKQVFEEMPQRDTPAWSAMIVAFAIHGHGRSALLLFEEMQRKCMLPDNITFLGVLYACSHTGLVEEGRRYFDSMSRVYGIEPGIKHYGCMVDLYGRAGLLDEAYEFVRSLPIKPTLILWRTLLAACAVHGNVELGKHVVDHIFEVQRSHSGDYVILSNMCAAAGRWDDVKAIRKLMKERGITKVPGCSSIEIDNAVHEFFSGDGEHPHSRKLHGMLDQLVEQLKLVGYVPDTSQVYHADMEEEEKEATLRYHSEKLAIAYGLLNTPPGTTIRVVKNLRVCGDCHSAANYGGNASVLFIGISFAALRNAKGCNANS